MGTLAALYFFLPPSTATLQLRCIYYAVTGESHLVTDTQNDSTLHSTLIAPFIQKYPRPLQTIIKPLHPRGTALSFLHTGGSTEPRKVNLPRSQELVTELRKNPQHQQLGQQLYCSLPMMPDLKLKGETLLTHCPDGSFSPCPLA